MAQKAKQPATDGTGKQFPSEAFDYNDDVSSDTVKKIRESRGVDVTDRKWTIIDAMGQVVPA